MRRVPLQLCEAKTKKTPNAEYGLCLSLFLGGSLESSMKVQVVIYIFRVLKNPPESFGETCTPPSLSPKPASRADVELLVRVID